MKKQIREEWEDELIYEILEDYILCAEHRFAAKDKKAHMEEMRGHCKKLIDFIDQLLTTERERVEGVIEGKKYVERIYRNKKGQLENLTTDKEKTHNQALDDILKPLSKTTMINNEVRRGMRDEVVGFRCSTCNSVVQSMWGTTCNKCRKEEERHKEILKAIKQE